MRVRKNNIIPVIVANIAMPAVNIISLLPGGWFNVGIGELLVGKTVTGIVGNGIFVGWIVGITVGISVGIGVEVAVGSNVGVAVAAGCVGVIVSVNPGDGSKNCCVPIAKMENDCERV